MPDAKAPKNKITMIQDADGQFRRVRIGESEIPVLHCGPAVGAGQMNFVLTIGDVEIDFETAVDTAA